MAVRTVILDFDGTFTDVDAEAQPFVDIFRADVADIVGRNVDEAWARHEKVIRDDPGPHGWEYQGRIVAPAISDPYIRTTTVAQRVFTEAGLLRQAELRMTISQALYQKAYTSTITAFKPEARDVLEAVLAKKLPVFVVTNARPDMVEKKLAALGLAGRLEVYGDAKKYVVEELPQADAAFDALPAEKWLSGLKARPIFVRRGKYFATLREIAKRTGVGFHDMLVAGDIYELDLALPAELGMQVQLVTRPETPPHEIEAVKALGARGGAHPKLEAILERI